MYGIGQTKLKAFKTAIKGCIKNNIVINITIKIQNIFVVNYV